MRPIAQALLLLAIGTLTPGTALAGPPVPPGHEQELLEMVRPFELGGDAVEGWQLRGLQVDRVWIDLVLESADGARAVVRLVHPDDATEDAIGHSRSFAILLIEGDAQTLGPALQRLAAGLETHDQGVFWPNLEAPPEPDASGATPYHPRRDEPGERPPARAGTWQPGVFALVLGLLGVLGLVARPGERPRARSVLYRATSAPVVAVAIAVVALGITAWTDGLAELFREPGRHHWDFRVYYHAAQAMAAGANPYQHVELARFAGTNDVLGCKYPPLSVALFTPLTALEPGTAIFVFLVTKSVALLALLGIWIRWLPGGNRGVLTAVMVAALWSYAFRMDLVSGNVSVFEQLALWLAVLALMQGRPLVFAVLVGLGATFKLLPLSYAAVALVVVEPRREALRAAAIAAGVVGVALGLSALLYPELTAQWWLRAVETANEGVGFHAPSLKAFFAGETPGLDPRYLAAVGMIVVGSVAALARGRGAAPLDRVMLAIVALTLIWPRLKDYTFMVLAAPAACLILLAWQRGRDHPAWRLLAVAIPVAAVLCTHGEGGTDDYRPLWLLLGVWAGYAAALAVPSAPRHQP